MLIYQLVLLLLLVWTVFNSFFMPKLKNRSSTKKPLVSILIPLRNEERNARSLVQSLTGLSYPNLEFILLDDQSADQTKEILLCETKHDARFTICSGTELPKGWSGKVHACHQLSHMANGDYYLFLDADVRVHKNTIESSLSLMKEKKAAMLSGFPRFPVKHVLEKLLVPMQHFLIYFHLPLFFANYTSMVSASAAHGAFMMFERKAYKQFGGHAAIKDSIVDDVALARTAKKNHHRVLLANVTDFVTCYMYDSNKEVWDGFKKNIFPGFGRSILIVILFTLFYSMFFIFPLLLAIYGIYFLISSGEFLLFTFIPLLLIILQKAFIDFRSGQKISLSFAVSFSAAAFLILLYSSMIASFKKSGYSWKGRTYH
ncbi:glycosyltransferase [Metabacillus idriensis]|uniref:glycosyltransferase n=1 Tax=Metabacillus idriensis TaxID=324768 RepID=UPI0028143B76|nr:glycosyltransferase [Metabacillus idriensis]MDR0137016.1 glycosyltransferase [Metabacillus idriensis]